MIQKYKIKNMTCGGCAHNIEGILSEINGVTSAKVDLSTNTASVEIKENIDAGDLSKYFENTKYELIKE